LNGGNADSVYIGERGICVAVRISHEFSTPQAPVRASVGTAALLVGALVVLGAFVFAVPYTPSALKAGADIFSKLAASMSGNTTTGTSTTGTNHSYNPLIQNGSANVQYPSDYSTLEAYALKIVNFDRANFSLPPVTLSTNEAGQQHADSMLRYGYFSHYDTQGYKPYMRYTLLGGKGADAENVAYISDPSANYGTTTLEKAMYDLENAMMYNDSACCNNGHRDNILNPLHNKVSFGVAYDSTHIYFDEEFENDYITLTLSLSSSNEVTITGTPIVSSVTDKVNSIYVAFDSTPQAETVAQLNNGPHEYGPGTLIGGALPKDPSDPLGGCAQFSTGITVCADTWTFNSSQASVSFNLQPFIRAEGSGAYTIYLITGSDTNSAITSISIFIA
jgi:uncharacterized protein YkwD